MYLKNYHFFLKTVKTKRKDHSHIKKKFSERITNNALLAKVPMTSSLFNLVWFGNELQLDLSYHTKLYATEYNILRI